ncbi:MAG: RNA methyltransferase [Tepidisphaeraceae bacterium]
MQIVLEGVVSVSAALRARVRRVQVVLVKHDAPATRVQEVLDLAAAANIPVRKVDGAELESMSHGSSHGGVLAICGDKPRWTGDDLLHAVERMTAAPLLLLLEGVDDARNLGFTIRTAEALGATAILLKKHLWDFDEADVARSASGAYERLPLAQFDTIEPLRQLQKRGVKLYGCLAGARRTIYDAEIDLSAPVCLAIGGEKRGLSGAVREICDQFITIPGVGGVSSLSLSHAGAIVLSEAFRQRRTKFIQQSAVPSPGTPGEG